MATSTCHDNDPAYLHLRAVAEKASPPGNLSYAPKLTQEQYERLLEWGISQERLLRVTPAEYTAALEAWREHLIASRTRRLMWGAGYLRNIIMTQDAIGDSPQAYWLT